MKIEKNIEIPKNNGHFGIGFGTKKYPFEEMSVGDSFFVEPCDAGQYGKTIRSAASNRNNRNNKDGRRFVVKAADGGYRCWRVE